MSNVYACGDKSSIGIDGGNRPLVCTICKRFIFNRIELAHHIRGRNCA